MPAFDSIIFADDRVVCFRLYWQIMACIAAAVAQRSTTEPRANVCIDDDADEDCCTGRVQQTGSSWVLCSTQVSKCHCVAVPAASFDHEVFREFTHPEAPRQYTVSSVSFPVAGSVHPAVQHQQYSTFETPQRHSLRR